MTARIFIFLRLLGLFLLIIAGVLIIIRWKYPSREVDSSLSHFEYWKRVFANWRKRIIHERERARSLGALRGKVILIVDPDERSLRVMGWKMSSVGATVVQARNGTQALVYVRDRRPDLIVTDALLPDISAVDFVAGLSEKDTPVVFVGVLENQWAEINLAAKYVACLPKPFDPDNAAYVSGELLRQLASDKKTTDKSTRPEKNQ